MKGDIVLHVPALGDNYERKTYPRDLFKKRLYIGRSKKCNLVLPDKWISREHCILEMCGGNYKVRDLGSKHGTYVNNGDPIIESPINHGDEIRVGLTTIIFEIEGSEKALVVEETTSRDS